MDFPRKYFFQILSIAFIIAAWQIAAVSISNGLILPGPLYVLRDFYNLLLASSFYRDLSLTILRGLMGFILAFILAALIGVPSGLSRNTRNFFKPVIILLRSIPVISFILLALIWFGPENLPVFIAFLAMFPLICLSIINGIENTDKELVEMGQVFRVKSSRLIFEVYLPSILPFLFNGMSNALGFGWRAVIIGEVLSQPRWGVGTQMQLAQTYLLVSKLICWTIVAIIVAFLFEWILGFVERRAMRWKK